MTVVVPPSGVVSPASAGTRELLLWLARAPRTYDETMEAWRSSCPRLTIWEDALAEGLVRVASGNGTPLSRTSVVLTARGHAVVRGIRTGGET